MKTGIGIVTFGNHEFTRLAVREILLTVKNPVSLYIVVGKPMDGETMQALLAPGESPFGNIHALAARGTLNPKTPRVASEFVRCEASFGGRKYDVMLIIHRENKGFPASINDIYDAAFGLDGCDNLVMIGNDVVPFPNGIDALIEQAASTDYEWICSCQYDVASLCREHPEAKQFFQGPNFIFSDFKARPWDFHKHDVPFHVDDGVITDVHNLCLFKRSVMEKIGYVDVNFFPAYFSDNDYCRRGWKEGLKTCCLRTSAYFHFWSRTIHQGSGGSTPKFYQLNERFYATKWGGGVRGQGIELHSNQGEQWVVPFDGKEHRLLGTEIILPGNRKIAERKDEPAIVDYWKRQ